MSNNTLEKNLEVEAENDIEKNDANTKQKSKTSTINISLEQEFDLRERRLKLVYKILYVVAIGWGTIFLSYIKVSPATNPIYCCILTIFTTVIINILYFIFNEFRCMKIFGTVEDFTKNTAELKFLGIWNSFPFSVLISILLTIINIFALEKLTLPLNISYFAIPIGIAFAFLTLTIYAKLNSKIVQLIKSICIPIISYCLFALVQTTEVILNA